MPPWSTPKPTRSRITSSWVAGSGTDFNADRGLPFTTDRVAGDVTVIEMTARKPVKTI